MAINIQLDTAAQLELKELVEALPFSKAKDELGAWLKQKRVLDWKSHAPEAIGQGTIDAYFNKRDNWYKSKQYLVQWAIDIANELVKSHDKGQVMPGLSEKHIMVTEDNRAVVIPPKVEIKEAKMNWTPANDMFNFGLILFEIATEFTYALFDLDWRYLINSDDQCKFAQDEKVADDCLKHLHALLTIPNTIARIIAQCLHENKDKRPTASSVLLALEKLQDGESETSDYRSS